MKLVCAGIVLVLAAAAQTAPQQPAPQAPTPQPPGAISGRVVNAVTGEPVRKATVAAIPLRGREARSAMTGNDGEFLVASLPPGDYRVSAQRNGFLGSNLRVMLNDSSGGWVRVTVRPGQTTDRTTVKLTPGAVISGRVLDEDSEPVLGAVIGVQRYHYSAAGRQLNSVGGERTNDLGEFRIFGLPPGKVVVSVMYRPEGAAGFAYHTVYYPGAVTTATAAALHLTPGAEMRGIDFRLRRVPAVRVSGRVNLPAGMRGMYRLIARDREEPSMPGGTLGHNDGRFAFPAVPAGSYTLEVSASSREEGRFYGAAGIEVGNRPVDNVSVDLGPMISARGQVRIEGEARRDLDLSQLDVNVDHLGVRTTGPAEVEMGEGGAFEVTNLIPGQYRVTVAKLPAVLYVKEIRQGATPRPDHVLEIPPGSTLTAPIEIVLAVNGGQIAGTVARGSGADPVEGATVVLIPEGERRAVGAFYRTALTTAAGAFLLQGIAPGKYKLLTWEQVESGAWFDPDFLAGYESGAETITVGENARETRQVRLP